MYSNDLARKKAIACKRAEVAFSEVQITNFKTLFIWIARAIKVTKARQDAWSTDWVVDYYADIVDPNRKDEVQK